MSEQPDASRQQLQTALDAVTASFAPGRPVSPANPPPVAAPAMPTEGKQELLTAFDTLVRYEATKPSRLIPELPATWKRLVRPAIIVASLSTALYLTMTRPAWLYPRFEPPADPASLESARRMLVASSLLVNQYQQQYGHLPAKMSDIRGSFPAVSMSGSPAGGYQLFSAVGNRSEVMTVPGAAR